MNFHSFKGSISVMTFVKITHNDNSLGCFAACTHSNSRRGLKKVVEHTACPVRGDNSNSVTNNGCDPVNFAVYIRLAYRDIQTESTNLTMDSLMHLHSSARKSDRTVVNKKKLISHVQSVDLHKNLF